MPVAVPASGTDPSRPRETVEERGSREAKEAYYGDAETAPQVCGLAAGVKQFGFAKSVTGPAPASGAAVVTQFVYDVMGRTVGTKTSGDTDWSCTSFDARGRVTQSTVAGMAGTTPRTVNTVYTPTATGSKVAVSDGAVTGSPNGSTITTITDLLGRVTSYTDVWNTVTTTQYESLTGRVTSTTTTPAGSGASVTGYEYDLDGKVTKVTIGSDTVATVSYDAAAQLTGVTYAGGSKLAAVARDAVGRVVGQTWTFPGSATISDSAVRSQAGRMVQETIARGATTYTSTYGYDAAGRLVTAAIPGHVLSYGFAGSGNCGAVSASNNAAAGASGNRTGLTDVYTAPGGSLVTSSTSYCYDWADRLTSSTVTNPVAGADSVTDGLAASELVYDGQGDLTRLGDATLTYDASGRHSGTSYPDGTTVAVVRDATDRVVARTTTPAGGTASTVTYVYDGAGDAAWAQSDGTGWSQTVDLPGGVTLTGTVSAGTFSYPSLLGHTLATGDGSTTGDLRLYDPYGQPLDMATLAIGTPVANRGGDVAGNDGWHQGAQKLVETAGAILLVEMGARIYAPGLGRFTAVDPVEGGGDNDYTWPTDPIGANDLTGQAWWDDAARWITDSPVGQTLMMACGFIPGVVGAACGAIETAAYLVQGRIGEAVLSAVSIAGSAFGARGVLKVLNKAAEGAIATRTAHVGVKSIRPSRKTIRVVTHSVHRQNDLIATGTAHITVSGAKYPLTPTASRLRFNWISGRLKAI